MTALSALRSLGAVRCAVCQQAICGHSDNEWLKGYPSSSGTVPLPLSDGPNLNPPAANGVPGEHCREG